MKIKYEYLNFATGIIITTVGFTQFYRGHIEMGLNWAIFGSMYLIMDDYIVKEGQRDFMALVIDVARKIFSWVGLLGSIFLLNYYLFDL